MDHMENETLESRLAALRDSSAERLPALAELHERLFAELAATVVPRVRAIGDQAPEIELHSASDDKLVRLSWMLDIGPVVVSFYRGFWCPYSNVQLSALVQEYPHLRKY